MPKTSEPRDLSASPLIAPRQRFDPSHWRGGEPPRFLFREDDPFEFSGSVGPDGDNRREDVIKAQILLGNSGHYRLAGRGVPTGWPGGELFRGIRAFQKEKGLEKDGLLLPPGPQGVDENGVGETLAALRNDLQSKLSGYAAPTPREVDTHYENEARFSGAADEGSDAKPPPDILLYDESGRPVGVKKIMIGQPVAAMINRPAPADAPIEMHPRQTRSDIDPPLPQWRDGQQVAMAAAPPPAIQPVQVPPVATPPQDPTGTTKPSSPYPHEQPINKDAALQLEKLLDTGLANAAANMRRWYENGQTFLDGLQRSDLPLDEAEQAAFTTLPGTEPVPPSRPMSDADKAATKTPPLAPPKADTELQGRPAEEQEPAIEKLIPPEMKEWHEGLEPFDQRLVREWMNLNANPHGSLGKPSTQLTDLKIAKLIAEEREEMFPELARAASHLYGSYPDGNKDSPHGRLKQEHIPGEGPGNKGSSRSDLSVGHPEHPEIRGRVNSVSGRWVDIGDGVKMFVHNDKEIGSFATLLKNINYGTAVTIGKLHDFPDEQTWEAHARPMVRMLLAGIRQQSYKAGLLQSAEPLNLPPPATFE